MINVKCRGVVGFFLKYKILSGLKILIRRSQIIKMSHLSSPPHPLQKYRKSKYKAK